MHEQSVLPVATPASGTTDLLSRLYREIGISAVAAALESINKREDRAVHGTIQPAQKHATR